MKDTVTIPREEYDRLREAAEELADILAFDRAMQDRDEGIPSDVMRRILEDESPVRVLREWRGMTAAELARRSGVHPVMVHEVETGKKRGSVETVKRLAEALGVRVDDLV
jgi:ribosome-binding protein aMBF1 (putative translation factor)